MTAVPIAIHHHGIAGHLGTVAVDLPSRDKIATRHFRLRHRRTGYQAEAEFDISCNKADRLKKMSQASSAECKLHLLLTLLERVLARLTTCPYPAPKACILLAAPRITIVAVQKYYDCALQRDREPVQLGSMTARTSPFVRATDWKWGGAFTQSIQLSRHKILLFIQV